jgi:hypothetical protein
MQQAPLTQLMRTKCRPRIILRCVWYSENRVDKQARLERIKGVVCHPLLEWFPSYTLPVTNVF